MRGGAEAARLAHTQEVEGSSPSPATKIMSEVPVVTKRLGEDRNVKSEITGLAIQHLSSRHIRLDIITPCEGDPSNRSRLQTAQSKHV